MSANINILTKTKRSLLPLFPESIEVLPADEDKITKAEHGEHQYMIIIMQKQKIRSFWPLFSESINHLVMSSGNTNLHCEENIFLVKAL